MTDTILIFTSRTGGGHVSLAEALRDTIQAANANYHIEIVDPQPSFIHWHYRMVSRYALWLWSAEFRLSDTKRGARLAHKTFLPGVAKPILDTIQRVRPALIITTYPFLTYEVIETLKRHKLDIPFVMLFTDPNGVHASWLTEKRGAATLAPTMETYTQALNVGFDPTRLHQVGWPVRAQFMQTDHHKHDEFFHEMKLDAKQFTIFLQGGGEGAAQFVRTVERMLALHPRPQIILATGTNTALQERFKATPNVFALPFTKQIAPYMAAADVIMGKAGPNMLFEAVTLGKPFIATAYIPGQEEANLEFIQRHQLGWVALKPDEQCALLTRLMNHPEELRTKDEMVEAYRTWNMKHLAAIMPVLEKLLNK